MVDLGSAHGTMTIDASQAIGSVRSVMSELQALSAMRVNIGAFDQIQSGAKDAAGALKELSGAKVSIDTSDAVGGLETLRSAAEDTFASMSADAPKVTIDTTQAVGDMNQLQSAVQDTMAAITSNAGSVNIDVSGALGQLSQLMADAQDLGSIFAGQALTVNIDTSAAQGELLALAVGIDDIAAAMSKLNSASVQIDTSAAQGALQSLMADVQDLAASVSGNAMSVNIETAGASAAINDLATELALTQQIAALPMSVNVQVNSSGLQDLQAQAANAKEAVESVGSAAPNINFSQAIGDLNRMAAQLGTIQGMMSGLGRFSLGAGLIGALLSPMIIGISYAAQLEQGLKNVSVALGGLGQADLSRLNHEIISIGTNTQFSAKEIADVAQNLAKAGYDVSEMIDGKMLPAVAALASATGDSLQTATMGIVQAMSLWSPTIADASIALTDASRAADILTVAANSSMASVEDIIRGIRNLGPIAVQMGVSFEDASAAIAVFTNYGLKGADAGVSLARGLQNLQQPTSDAQQLMDELGISLFTAQGKFIGMQQMFGQLSNALRDATQEQKLNAISTLFGAEAMDAYAIAIAAGVDPLAQIVTQMQANDVAMGQATERTQTFLGALERLGETTQTALGYMAQPFIGPLTFLANTMTAVGQTFAALPQPITGAIGALTGIAGTIAATAIAASTLRTAFSGIGNILGSAPGIAQGIAGFKKLTSAIQGSAKAMAVLSFATGPIGISIGALALGIGALWLLARKQDQDAKQSQEAYQSALKQTNQLITDKLVSGQTKLATAMEHTAQTGRTAMTTVETRMTSFGNQWDSVWNNFIKTQDYASFDGFFQTPFGDVMSRWVQNADTSEVSSYIKEGVQDAFDNGVSATNLDAVKSAKQLYFESFFPTNDDKAMLEGHMQDFFKVLENPNIDTAAAQKGFDDILMKYMTSETPSREWLDTELTNYINYLNSAQGQADLALEKMQGLSQAAQDFQFTLAGLRADGLTTIADQLETASTNFADLNGKLQTADLETYTAMQSKVFDIIKGGGADVEEYNRQMALLDEAYNNNTISAAVYAQGAQGLAIWLANTVKQIEQVGDAWTEMAAGMRLDKNFEGADRVEEFTKNYAKMWSELTNPADKQLLDKDLNTIFQLMASGKVDVDLMTAAIADLNRQYDMGQLTAEQYVAAIHQMVLNQDDYAISTAKAAGAQAKMNGELIAGAAAAATYAEMMKRYNAQKNAEDVNKEIDAAKERAEAMKNLADGVKEVIQARADFNEENFGNFADIQGLDPRVMAYGMTDFASETAKAGIAAQSIQTTYSNIYRVIVGNTDAVSQLATTTQEWADNLIAAEGTEGKIDDLLARKVINQQQYNDAQKAYNSIAEDTAKIQDYTLKIQTNQAPVIAAQTKALEQQYALIAEMPAQQQLVALGWMDSATAADALSINAMAAGVAAGEGGEAGRVGFEKMLESIVATNPALAAVLDDMGLIELSADKQHIIKINYDMAEGAESEIARLTRSIDALTIALGGIPPFDIDTFPLLDASQRAAVLRNELERLKAAGKADDILSGLNKGFFGGGADSPVKQATNDVKGLADMLAQLAQGKNVDINLGASADNLRRVSDALKTVGEQGDIEKKVKIDFENPDNMEKLKEMIAQGGKAIDIQTRFSQSGGDDAKATLDNLKSFDGRVITVSTKFDTKGDAPDLSQFERGGPSIPTIHIPTVFDPPHGNQFNPSKPETVHIPTQFDAPTSGPDIPTPDTVEVPVKFTVASAGGFGPTKVPAGMESALGGGGAAPAGITIPVKFTVSGAEQFATIQTTINGLQNKSITTAVKVNGAELIGALRLDVQNLSNKTVTVTASVSGAELIGALRLDVQNLTNKTVTVTAVVSGAESIGALKLDIQNLSNKTVTIMGDNADAMLKWQAVQNLTNATKWLFIFGDGSQAGALYSAISTLPDVSKWLFVFGDNSDAQKAYADVEANKDLTRSLTITGDNSGAMGAYNELSGLADITKTMTINVQVNGTIPAGFAKGGITGDAVVRAGERGAEAFRTPHGTTGILPTDSLYSLPVGTRIFTAAQTRRMMSDMKGMFPAFARGGVVGTPVNTAVMQSAYAKSVYRQLTVILKEIRDSGGDALKDTAKAVEDMMKDLSTATSDAVSGVMNDLKDFGWPAPKTTALMNQTQAQQTKDAKAQAGSTWDRLDAIATEVEKYGGSSMESIAKSARDMQRGGAVTEEAVTKMVKDLQDKGWAGTKTAALAKTLKETATSLTDASALFSDDTWDKRLKKVGNPNDVKDLFSDRTRRNARDFTIDNGKVLEHYGGQQPPSGVGQAPKAGDTFVIQSLTPEGFAEVLDGAQDGRITQTTIARARAAYTTRGIVTPVKG